MYNTSPPLVYAFPSNSLESSKSCRTIGFAYRLCIMNQFLTDSQRSKSALSFPKCPSIHMYSMNVAKPSFSQMFPQSLHVTRSPNHWCPSSCEINGSSSVGNSGISLGWRSELAVLVVALEFSIPPATKSSTIDCAYFSQG